MGIIRLLRGTPFSERDKATSGFPIRFEIVFLRGASIGFLIIAHYWAGIATGAYIFIDVFFVVSGFLTTQLLLFEWIRKDRIKLSVFWMRGARRILPAGTVVLLVCIPATLIWAPLGFWDDFFSQIMASGLFVENWFLSFTSADYLNMDRQASPVQNFWTLSIEEQFYFFWPFIIILAGVIARKLKLGLKGVLLAVLGVFTLGCFAYAIWLTSVNQAAAYFQTPSRVWAMAAGGILAVLGVSGPGRDKLRSIVSWGSIVALVVIAFLFNRFTPYPGPAALLPVLLGMAVVWAGVPDTKWGPGWLFKARISRWLGDTSYSIYLWHWPVFVFAPFILDREILTTPIKLGMLAFLLLISGITRRFVEDPIRLNSGVSILPRLRPRAVFLIAAGVTAFLVFCCWMGIRLAEVREADRALSAQNQFNPKQRCFGAASRDPLEPCVNPALRLQAAPVNRRRPNPFRQMAARLSRHEQVFCDRVVPYSRWTSRACLLGVSKSQAKRNIALIGDSRSVDWRPAFKANANRQGWRVLANAKLGCAWNNNIAIPPIVNEQECRGWRADIPSWLRSYPEIDTVVLASGVYKGKDEGDYRRQVEGYKRSFSKIPASVKHIVVIRDIPRSAPPKSDGYVGLNVISSSDADVCIDRALGDGLSPQAECSNPRDKVLNDFPDPAVEAARDLGLRGSVLDLTNFFCSPNRCFTVIGGAVVYVDSSHITPAFSRTLAPYLMRSWRTSSAGKP